MPISSTKSMIGHALGGAGAIEAVACVKSIQQGVIHPTANYEYPDPDCDLDYVPNEARRAEVDTVLSNSFGFGGQNACVVFSKSKTSGGFPGRGWNERIWIVSDTFRKDHIGAYGNTEIHTPSLDALAARSVRFDGPLLRGVSYHAHSGRPRNWALDHVLYGLGTSAHGVTTLAEILASHSFHTAASVDTPYYLRDGMNYDRGFQSFFMNRGQDTLWSLIPIRIPPRIPGCPSGMALRIGPQRSPHVMTAMRWLENHYKEDFFLYVDTWDPHEPWDAPAYYTELYWPGYDGELVLPLYGNWNDVPGYEEEQVRKGHAAYCGEITMVDTWLGHLLKSVENMG